MDSHNNTSRALQVSRRWLMKLGLGTCAALAIYGWVAFAVWHGGSP